MIEKMTVNKVKTMPNRRKPYKKFSFKNVYIIFLVVIIVICGIHALHQLTNSVSSTVMINSVFAAEGQNPDGTPFSIVELLRDDVLQMAVEELEVDLSTEELRSHLTISDTMTNKSFAKLEQSIFDGENKNTYFPTEYIITYSTITDQIRDEGFSAQCKTLWRSFFLPSKTEILNAVLKSYHEYYAGKYLDYDALFDTDWSIIDSMDYYNRFEIMDDTIQQLLRFLYYKNHNNIMQGETSTQTEYNDLIVEFSQGPAKDLSDYKAYVTQNGVTNAKEELLRQFLYMQTLFEEENTRKMQEYNVLRDAIELYDSTTTKVVFIPALDDDKEFYMNRTKVGMDYLTEKADEAKLQADSASYSAKQYAYLRSCFGEEYIYDEYGNKIQIKNTPDQRAHADGLYERLKAEILRLTEEVDALAAEGKQLNREDLNIKEPFCGVSIVSVGLSSAKKFAVLFMLAYVVVFVTEVLYEKKQKGRVR